MHIDVKDPRDGAVPAGRLARLAQPLVRLLQWLDLVPNGKCRICGDPCADWECPTCWSKGQW